MHRTTKVATCCYCGTRAALVLVGDKRHELACSSCGAPLHDLKMLPKGQSTDKGKAKELLPEGRKTKLAAAAVASATRKVKKKKKKRKGLGRKLFEEAFDVLEDIFD